MQIYDFSLNQVSAYREPVAASMNIYYPVVYKDEQN